MESAGLRILAHIRAYSENPSTGEKTADEVSRIVKACRELEALVTPPQTWNLQIATAHHRATVMCLFLDWKIPQILSDASEAMRLDQLAEASGVAERLLRGILRECVAQFIIDEPRPEVYQLNRHSRSLLKAGFAALIQYHSDVNLRAGSCLPEYVSMIRGHPRDCSLPTAFQMAFKTDTSFYQFHEHVDRTRGARFDAYMETMTAFNDKPIELFFPFNQLKPASLVVDVGGGKGHNSIRLARQQPHLAFIVQDYEGKRPLTTDENNEAIPHQVQWQQCDYLLEQPVKGADVYLLSQVLIDWNLR
ncbi:hypothetical protein BJX99DRAFT_252837 [Aspergillus californicus]